MCKFDDYARKFPHLALLLAYARSRGLTRRQPDCNGKCSAPRHENDYEVINRRGGGGRGEEISGVKLPRAGETENYRILKGIVESPHAFQAPPPPPELELDERRSPPSIREAVTFIAALARCINYPVCQSAASQKCKQDSNGNRIC